MIYKIHNGIKLWSKSFKIKIDDPQNSWLLFPINKSLKIYPEKIDPKIRMPKGIVIDRPDSLIFDFEIFLLLNFPWKVLKINLHE